MPRTEPQAFDRQQAHAHSTRLRVDPQAANPPDWRVDWADAPWPFKIYDGGRRISVLADSGTLAEIDHLAGAIRLLRAALGVARIRWEPKGGLPPTPERPDVGNLWRPMYTPRRVIPAGGGAYPAEAYLVTLGQGEHPPQAFHYDAYRDELVDLEHPCPGRALRRALDLQPDSALPPAAIVLTHCFWKNSFKYSEFAYRLGAVDVGVALGRLLQVAAPRVGRVRLWVDFHDAELDHMLGLDGLREGAYAVLGLGEPTLWTADGGDTRLGPQPPPVRERSHRVGKTVGLEAMHRGARYSVAGAPKMTDLGVSTADRTNEDSGSPVITLPAVEPLDIHDPELARHRRSNGQQFTGGACHTVGLTRVLTTAAAALDDLRAACPEGGSPGLQLFCAVDRVMGVPPGWYRYRFSSADLVACSPWTDSACATLLQRLLHVSSINIEQASFTVHIVGATDLRHSSRGVREHRVQLMHVGVALDAVVMASTAVGLGSHPIMGFDGTPVDEMYGLTDTGLGVQAQICVGLAHPGLGLEGNVVAP